MLRAPHPAPMLDRQLDVLGVPAILVILAIGAAGTITGILLLRRLLTIEPEAHSFASTRRPARIWPYALIVIGCALLTLVAAVVLIRGPAPA